MPPQSRERAGSKQITRAAELDNLRDLTTPRRAYLAYVKDGMADATMVESRRDDGRWLVTLAGDGKLADGLPVVLLIDDGELYFELRGIRVPGRLQGSGRERELIASRTICWQYGSMRERTP
jgi:hypothetical protein